jgi:hypothetical protein
METNPIVANEHLLTDSRPGENWGIRRGPVVNYRLDQKPRFWVVDDFYADPDSLREFALLQSYFPGEGAVGHRTRKQFLFDGLKEQFESIMGKKIADHTEKGTGWYDEGVNGRFQSCPAGTDMVFHCDHTSWAAIIYLSPDAPTQSGTSFYKHKKTGLRHADEIDWAGAEGSTVFNGKTFVDPTPYERIDTVGNIYNRLIIFDGRLIHSGQDYFGWDIASGRFFQIFFFDEQK